MPVVHHKALRFPPALSRWAVGAADNIVACPPKFLVEPQHHQSDLGELTECSILAIIGLGFRYQRYSLSLLIRTGLADLITADTSTQRREVQKEELAIRIEHTAELKLKDAL